MEIEIIKTEDGSNTLYSKTLKEYYHSKFGAINESKHVFINAGFKHLDKLQKTVNILEVGFGTGLNAYLTCLSCLKSNIKVNYYGIDPFPLDEKIYRELNYHLLLHEKNDTYMKLQEAEWNKEVRINNLFNIHKLIGRIEELALNTDFYHMVYFDAFAPDIQEELWTKPVFNKIRKSMKPGGIFVTYSAKGAVRRNLEACSFNVERIQGPTGKREMIRAFAR